MKNTVIYHSADYDGIFCREIARKFLPPDTTFIGWNHGEPLICLDGVKGPVYILDLSPDCLRQHPNTPPGEVPSNVIWIDHHKSSIEKWPAKIFGYRIDGVAACRLTYQWFTGRFDEPHGGFTLPSKDMFIERRLEEPLAVRLAGEYDIWDKRDPRAEVFQFGLDAVDVVPWEYLLSPNGEAMVEEILSRGESGIRVIQKRDSDIMLTRSFQSKFEGLKFLCLNTARCNSNSFSALDKPETGHDALLGFYWNGKTWTVSLYHAKHNTGIDLSLIAVKYKGGGHRGACGFTCQEVEFLNRGMVVLCS